MPDAACCLEENCQGWRNLDALIGTGTNGVDDPEGQTMKVPRPMYISIALLGIAIVLEVAAGMQSVRAGHSFPVASLGGVLAASVIVLCALSAANRR